MPTRRRFLQNLALTSASAGMLKRSSGEPAPATGKDAVSFFLVGDTHYRAEADDITRMNGISAG